MSDQEKLLAAEAAAPLVRDGMRLGLGTGSTAAKFVRLVGERMKREGLRLSGVCTSSQTEQIARECGIPIEELDADRRIDLYVDGADEIDGEGNMIKGGGGALLREKLVALQATRRVIIADGSKEVVRLGTTFRLPVEIVRFGSGTTVARIAAAEGCTPHLRLRDGAPFLTDEGNLIVDCEYRDGIADAPASARRIKAIHGVVETGLFIGLCDVAMIARSNNVSERTFSGSHAST